MNLKIWARRFVSLPWPPLLAVAIVIALACIVVWRQSAIERKHEALRPLVVLVGGDTQGLLQPYGCAAAQPGGLARRGTLIRRARESADALIADLGNAPGGSSAYDVLKFTSILRGEMALGLAAHNLGPGEVLLGAEALRKLSKEINVPFVSANVCDANGDLIARPLRMIKAGRQRIAIVGLLDPQYASADLIIDEPSAALADALQGQSEEYDTLLVLAYLDATAVQKLQKSVNESTALLNSSHNPASILMVIPQSTQAELLLVASSPKNMAPQQLDRGWLAAVKPAGANLVRFDMAVAPTATWQAGTIAVDATIPEDMAQLANLERYHRLLADQDFTASQTGIKLNLPPEVASEQRVAGTQSCRACHASECMVWDNSRHARAFQTLVDRGVQYESACQKCHTTGYGWPGGFESADRSPNLATVSCESCHGPSLSHAIDPRIRTTLSAKQQCLQCHDATNSPAFAFETAWPLIQHGRLNSGSKAATH